MIEILRHIKVACIGILVFITSLSVCGVEKQSELLLTEDDKGKILEQLKLGELWELQLIDGFSLNRPKEIEKSISIIEDNAGNNSKIDEELANALQILTLNFGVHVTFCYDEDSTCLTWVFIKDESQNWRIDNMFERY
jgi:hypothetical protein